METIFEREKHSIFQTYKRMPIAIDRALGAKVWDKDGNEYLDFLAGIAVNALGHTHPAVVKAITEQVSKYMHVSNYFYQEPQVKLAEKLVELSGLGRVFYSNSGTEAIDGAIKLARRWGHEHGKTELVAFSGGFHGRTYGALSIMDKPKYKEHMGPYLEGTKVIEHNNIAQLNEHINESTAAVFLEFVQGEGGISTPTQEFIDELIKLKTKFGFLLVADEIQAGTGRTGKFFGYEHFGVKPDVITLAKGIGGGLPLGAIIADESLANVWDKGTHGTTYGGNAVACAAGLAVVEELMGGVMDNVCKTGDYMKSRLDKLKAQYPEKILEVRGIGLMRGLLLSFDAGILVEAMLKHRVIANAASGTILRIVPPLIISNEDVDKYVDTLEICLKEMK